VMLTAITTVLGLLPMALGVSIDFTRGKIDMGSQTVEWWGPMARSVSFGLIFATVLTLIVVPVMYQTQENMTNAVVRAFRFVTGASKRAQKKSEEAAS
jgi:multidrug efflux pump